MMPLILEKNKFCLMSWRWGNGCVWCHPLLCPQQPWHLYTCQPVGSGYPTDFTWPNLKGSTCQHSFISVHVISLLGKGKAIYQLRNKDIMYFEVWVVKKPMIWHWFYIKVRNKWGSSCKKHYYTELYFTHIWVMKRGREHSSNNWQRKRRAYNSAARGNLLIPTRHNSGHYIYLTDKESSMKKKAIIFDNLHSIVN